MANYFKINPTQCLKKTSFIWIQPNFTRCQATEILQNLTKGMFIIRMNLKKHLLVISYRTKIDIQHVIINVVKNGGFYMDGSENIFQNIVEMISHYMRHPILRPKLKLNLPRALLEAYEPIHFNCLENLNSNFWTKNFYSKTITEILKENMSTVNCTSMSKLESDVCKQENEKNYYISDFNTHLTPPNLLACKASNDTIFSIFWTEDVDDKHFQNLSFNSKESQSLNRLSCISPMTNYERLNKTTSIWIQPSISRNEAEKILDKFENGIFIVRLKENSKNITLSYKSILKVNHSNINIDLQKGFVIEGSIYTFHNINVLISHFMTCPIENSGLLLNLPRPLREAKMSHHFTFLNSLKLDFWNSPFANESIYRMCKENFEPTFTDNEDIPPSNDFLNIENSENFCQSQFLHTAEQDETEIYISFEQ